MMENSKIRILALDFARYDRRTKMNEKAMIRNWYYQITHLIQKTTDVKNNEFRFFLHSSKYEHNWPRANLT